MPERKHAGAPDAVLARPLSLPSYPVATGRPRPGHQRPHALRVTIKVNAGHPDAVLARPLSLPSYPVATGRPRPGHQRPRALRLIKEVNAGPRKTINLNYPLSQLVRSGRGEADPVAESVAAAASNRKSLQRNRRRRRRSHTSQLRRASFFGTHAPRDKENHPASPKCRRESTPEPPMLFWRDPSRCRATP